MRQNYIFVDEYTKEFYKLHARKDLNEDKEQSVARYINGLRLLIQEMVSLYDLYRESNAYRQAHKVEGHQQRSTRRMNASKTTTSSSDRAQATNRATLITPQGASTSRHTQVGNDLINRSKGLVGLAPGTFKCFKCDQPGLVIALLIA